jgi:orotate phosphoribosyltransferase
MTLRRGFAVEKGERALVVEDVITTGGSAREVVDALGEMGTEVIGVGSIIDRSGGRAEFGVPFKSLAHLIVSSFTEAECPLCRRGEPVYKPGSRKS